MIYLGLLVIFFLEYVRPTTFFPGSEALRIQTIVPLGVAAAAFFSSSRVSNEDVVREPTTKLLLAFVGLLLLSVLTAAVTTWAWTIFTVVLGNVLVYFIIVKQVNTVKRLLGVFKVLVLLHLVVTGLNPQLFAGGRQYLAYGGYFLGDGNDFALSVNVVIPLCLFLALQATKMRSRLFYGGALLVLVFDVVSTQSRGGTLALMSVGVYYWLKSSRKLLTASVAAVALVVIVAYAPEGYFLRMQSMADTEEGSAEGRIEAWKAAGRMALDNPVLGVGAGHFSGVYGQRYSRLVGGPHAQTAHSVYFLILGELGPMGLGLVLAMIVVNFWSNASVGQRLRSEPKHRLRFQREIVSSTSASLMAFAVGGAFLSAAYYPHLYYVLGVLVAARQVAIQSVEEQAPHNEPQRIVDGTGLSPHFTPRRRRLQGRHAAAVSTR